MPPDLSPDAVRGRTFETALRGYDRAAVEGFQREVATELGKLTARIGELEALLTQLGIDDVSELGAELQKLGSDITSILEEARRTATELRERANADATKWRSEAEMEAAALRTSSQAEAEQIRADAWNQSSQMLEQVTADVEDQIAVAKQDALFIRAEAERESLHMTADARREAEELLRAAKTEAERMTANAQAKASRTLEEARQAADGAQERARALEARRAELLIELDAARLSIGQIEKQIDERREELEEAEGSSEQWPEPRSHWQEDDGSVRLVSPARFREPEPVDPEAFIEEVERLRSEPGDELEETPEDDVAPQPEAETAREPAAEAEASPAGDTPAEPPADEGPSDPAADQSGDEAAAAVESAPDAAADALPAREPTIEPATDEADQPVEETGEDPSPDAEVVETPEPVETVSSDETPASEATVAVEAEDGTAGMEDGEAETGALDDLFQRLRHDGTADDKPELQPEPAPDMTPEAAEESAVATPDQALDAEPASATAPDDEEPDEELATTSAAGATIPVRDAVEMRDRFVLPIENRALRSVKRRIVDLQNRALEELRIGDGPWTPDRAMFTADLGPDLSKLAQEAYVAGHRAAVEMTGQTGASPPATRTRTDATALVVDGLAEALSSAYGRAQEQGSGARQLAAAVSRVFRGWRTDEAERRLRTAAHTAYHEGVVAGLAAMGAPQAIVVAEGSHAAQCPSVTGVPFDPAAASALRLPPAHAECPATVVAAP